MRTQRGGGVLLATLLSLTACGGTPRTTDGAAASEPARFAATPEATAAVPVGAVIAAPGSSSRIFPPNPGAIVVGIDPGHGGCLDWGVPNPFDNTVARAEKTMTLGIAMALAERLESDGISVVLARTGDEALAGDREPDFGCDGEPFRDVNGDGATGFDPEGYTLARDELTARIDLANLARADVFLSIHINSMTENGEVHEIAATQTFYTDEVAWGESSERLAADVQRAVVAGLEPIADYPRQDRGTQAINYFVIAPPLLEPSEDKPDPRKRPRGIQMPGVLAEVGSISLEREADLLASAEGQAAVADSLFAALESFLSERPIAVRYDAAIPAGDAGRRPDRVPGDGPPFRAPAITSADLEAPLRVRVTNTGTRTWPAGTGIVAGWAPTDEPYLAAAPERLVPLGVDVPLLRPGESVWLEVELPTVAALDRKLLWLTLTTPDARLDEAGSPPLQIAWEGP